MAVVVKAAGLGLVAAVVSEGEETGAGDGDPFP